MHDHYLAVGGEVDVQLDDVGTLLEGEEGALYRVLGGVGGDTAVTDVEGGAGHGVLRQLVAGDIQQSVGGVGHHTDGARQKGVVLLGDGGLVGGLGPDVDLAVVEVLHGGGIADSGGEKGHGAVVDLDGAADVETLLLGEGSGVLVGLGVVDDGGDLGEGGAEVLDDGGVGGDRHHVVELGGLEVLDQGVGGGLVGKVEGGDDPVVMGGEDLLHGGEGLTLGIQGLQLGVDAVQRQSGKGLGTHHSIQLGLGVHLTDHGNVTHDVGLGLGYGDIALGLVGGGYHGSAVHLRVVCYLLGGEGAVIEADGLVDGGEFLGGLGVTDEEVVGAHGGVAGHLGYDGAVHVDTAGAAHLEGDGNDTVVDEVQAVAHHGTAGAGLARPLELQVIVGVAAEQGEVIVCGVHEGVEVPADGGEIPEGDLHGEGFSVDQIHNGLGEVVLGTLGGETRVGEVVLVVFGDGEVVIAHRVLPDGGVGGVALALVEGDKAIGDVGSGGGLLGGGENHAREQGGGQHERGQQDGEEAFGFHGAFLSELDCLHYIVRAGICQGNL